MSAMVKVSQLSGAALDLWVAKAAGIDAVLSDPHRDGSRSAVTFYSRDHDGHLDGRSYCPSSHWSDGGPIIERERIELLTLPTMAASGGDAWMARSAPVRRGSKMRRIRATGPTILIAAMRAFVSSKFGEEVEEITGVQP